MLASLKVVPSSAAEGQEANFPRNLHNAAELFLRAGLAQNARRCIQRCSALLEVLKEGPDGKRSHSMGRGAVCWQCGHCGLPANAAAHGSMHGVRVRTPVAGHEGRAMLCV